VIAEPRHRLTNRYDRRGCNWKALSQRIGHADVAFTMKQYVQTDLEADRQVASTLAELIIGGSLASVIVDDELHGSDGSKEGDEPESTADEGDEDPAA
jgi:cyanate lyase